MNVLKHTESRFRCGLTALIEFFVVDCARNTGVCNVFSLTCLSVETARMPASTWPASLREILPTRNESKLSDRNNDVKRGLG